MAHNIEYQGYLWAVHRADDLATCLEILRASTSGALRTYLGLYLDNI